MSAYLPPIVPSPFSDPFNRKPYNLGDPPFPHCPLENDSTASIGTVHITRAREISANSFVSASSTPFETSQSNDENRRPYRTLSIPTLESARSLSSLNSFRKPSRPISHKSSWGTGIPVPPRTRNHSCRVHESASLEDVDLSAACGSGQLDEQGFINGDTIAKESSDTIGSVRKLEGPSGINGEWQPDGPQAQDIIPLGSGGTHPFKRWMKTLRRRKSAYRQISSPLIRGWSVDETGNRTETPGFHTFPRGQAKHSKRSSVASSGLIGTVKTASLSIASFGVAPRSKRHSRASNQRSTIGSGPYSDSDVRPSVDSGRPTTISSIDDAAWTRAAKRRQILEEILSSEESYVADLKALTNVQTTLLASVQALSGRTRSSIQRNIQEILKLHDALLNQLHHTVFNADEKGPSGGVGPLRRRHKHVRWHSLESADGRSGEGRSHRVRDSVGSIDQRLKGGGKFMTAEPSEAAEVACVFKRFIIEFFAYEEYCAKYEMMAQDVALSHKYVPSWQAYETGIEALAKSLVPINSREGEGKKGLTVPDLLIKPIQRVSKYPLLFADLLKQTPVVDCPSSHVEIDRVLQRLREIVREVNTATNDPTTRDKIQRTWLLQERLNFPNETTRNGIFRTLGHALLCGVLHVAYQTKTGVMGGYMLCVLFKTYLLLAIPVEDLTKFNVVATVHIADLKIESTEDGKGLQCHAALYTWKAIFESDNHLFEVIFSACSQKEEDMWKNCLLEQASTIPQEPIDERPAPRELFTTTSLDLKPVGNIFGQPGTLARRISIQRAATVGMRSNVCQVIIRNTHKSMDTQECRYPLSPSMNRSQSLLTTHRITVLAPKRSSRIRLEHSLGDVWTKDILPFPGMVSARGDHLIRASAGSLIRKISMASISSPFGRRSSSLSVVPVRKSNETFPVTKEEELQNDDDAESEALPQIGSSTQKETQEDEKDFSEYNDITSKMNPINGFRRLKRRQTGKCRRLSKTMTTSPLEAPSEKVMFEETINLKKRWSNRMGLLKTLSSAEGIRNFLYKYHET